METELISVKVVWEDEEHPDVSYLESKIVNGKVEDSCRYTQNEYDANPEQVMKWVEEDMHRLETYGEHWIMMGCKAKAIINVPIQHNSENSIIQTITSGGLWGIESDSTPEYLKEVETEELECLRLQLEALGVSTSKFNHLVTRGEDEQ